jgi:uroporphyrinogen decarboxylase
MGEVPTLYAYYDDPQLIHTILHDLTEFWISLYDQVLQEVKPDSAEMWEDMCYNSGPMISPQMFREFMLPYYKRLTRFFNDHGIDVIVVDTDGRCDSLIPLFVEGGVTCMVPMEARAGMDPLKVREAFPGLRFCGAIDKYAVAAGGEALRHELETKVRPLLQQGGYIPYIDHNVPPEISWANYKAYREQLNDIIDKRR